MVPTSANLRDMSQAICCRAQVLKCPSDYFDLARNLAADLAWLVKHPPGDQLCLR
jgi:hypothetical protein